MTRDVSKRAAARVYADARISLLQGSNRFELLLLPCQLLVGGQLFPVQVPPFQKHRFDSRRKLPVDIAIGDSDRAFHGTIAGVKVGSLLLPMVHRDDDSKRKAESRAQADSMA